MKKKWLSLLSIGFLLSLTTNASAAKIDRLGGNNRYETAAKINNQMKSDTLILVSGNNFADALSSTSLVYYYNAEIHLVNKELDANTINSLNNNEFKKAIIVGGTGVVSSEIENTLKTKLGNENVERLGGSNRYETSELVAAKVLELQKSYNTFNSNHAFVVTGKDFPDALSVAPIAAKFGNPIILTPGDSVGKLGINILNNIYGYTKIGGETVVSDKIDELIGKDSSRTSRISGSNRYETNKAVISKFINIGFSFDNVYVANGLNFPDALAGSALAAKKFAPIVFVSNNNTTDAKDVVSAFQSKNLIALGGTGVVSNETLNKLIDTNSADKEMIFKHKGTIVYSGSGEITPKDIGLVALGKKGNDCSWSFNTSINASEKKIFVSGVIDGQLYQSTVNYTTK